ncbi:MAG: PEP-CTERM sorting domain-containing protein [Pirellulales bacterium]|nr:PEP-CTERM sorting domain-containing protein [Pirellulales bacterium]
MRNTMWLQFAVAAAIVGVTAPMARAAGYVDTLTGMSGLISYWNLNESSGLLAADLVTNDTVDGNNAGAYSGNGLTVGGPGMRPADGFYGFADDNRAPIFSDKSSDVLQMPNYTGYGNRTDLTMMGWIKFNEPNAGVEAHFGGLERVGSDRYLFAAHYDARFSDLRARIRQYDDISWQEYAIMSRAFIPDDQRWHFFVMTYESATTMRLYLDGWQQDADSFSTDLGMVIPSALVFGHDADFANAPLRGLNGQLDELAFVDRAITPQEVRQLWDAATLPELGKTATAPYRQTVQKLGGLRNYWRFDETTGTTFVDAVAGNNGALSTVSGFPANVGRPGPAPADGFAGMPTDNASIQFVAPDGAGYVSTQDGQVLGAPTTGLPFGDGGVSEMTMSLWFKNTYDAAGYVAGFERSGDSRYVFAAHHPTGTTMRFYVRSLNEEALVTGDLPIDVAGDFLWHHLVQVWDGTEKRLTVYIDGRERYSDTNDLMSEYLAVPEGFFIGRDQLGDTRELGGFVDEISLFDRAFSAAEAFELYDAAFFEGPAPRVPGDASGDGKVNAADAALLAAHWLKATGAVWGEGDFNEDGAVDDLDLAILAANWSTAAGAAVPEPASLALIGAGLLAALGLVRRTHWQSQWHTTHWQSQWHTTCAREEAI